MTMLLAGLRLQLLALTAGIAVSGAATISDAANWLFPHHIVEPLVPCNKEGFFAHPRDCRWFYRCVDTNGMGSFRRFYFECDPNKIFITEINKCDYVHVLSDPTTPCTSFPTSQTHNSSTENLVDTGQSSLSPEISSSLSSSNVNATATSLIDNQVMDSNVQISDSSKIPISNYVTEDPSDSPISSSIVLGPPKPQSLSPESSNAIMDQFQPAQMMPTSQGDRKCVIVVGDCQYRMLCVEPLWEAHRTIIRVCLQAFYRCSGDRVKNVDLCLKGSTFSPQERYCVNDGYFCRDPSNFNFINPPSPPRITAGPPSVSPLTSARPTTTPTTSTTTTPRTTSTTSKPNVGAYTTPPSYLTTSRTTKGWYSTLYPQSSTTSRPLTSRPVGPPIKPSVKPPFRPPTTKPPYKPLTTTNYINSIWWKPFRPTRPSIITIPTTTPTTTTTTTTKTTTTTTTAKPTTTSTQTGDGFSVVALALNETVRCSRANLRPLEKWMIRYFCLEYHLCNYRGRYQGRVLLCHEFLECRPLIGGAWEVARMKCPLPWLYSFDKHICAKPPAAQELCSSLTG